MDSLDEGISTWSTIKTLGGFNQNTKRSYLNCDVILDTSLNNSRNFGLTPKLLRDTQVTGILVRARELRVFLLMRVTDLDFPRVTNKADKNM